MELLDELLVEELEDEELLAAAAMPSPAPAKTPAARAKDTTIRARRAQRKLAMMHASLPRPDRAARYSGASVPFSNFV